MSGLVFQLSLILAQQSDGAGERCYLDFVRPKILERAETLIVIKRLERSLNWRATPWNFLGLTSRYFPTISADNLKLKS